MILEKKITSVEVAEMVDKSHNELLKDIRRYSEQLGEGKIPQSYFFEESTYMNTQNKEQPCYLVSKMGCEFIGSRLTGTKGTTFLGKYIIKFNQMEETINTPLSVEQMMRIQLQMVDGCVGRIEKLENTMTIDYGQQLVLKNLVNSVVVEYLGGKGTNAYKSISKVVFSEINKDFQRYFNVNARNNTPKMSFEKAVEYIKEWTPSANTRLNIVHHNSQMSFA